MGFYKRRHETIEVMESLVAVRIAAVRYLEQSEMRQNGIGAIDQGMTLFGA